MRRELGLEVPKERVEKIGLKIEEEEGKLFVRATADGVPLTSGFIATFSLNAKGKLMIYLNSGVNSDYVETDDDAKIVVKKIY